MRMTFYTEKETEKLLTRIHRKLKTTNGVEYQVVQYRYVWKIMDEFVKKHPAYFTTFDVMDAAERHAKEDDLAISEALCNSIYNIDDVLTEHFANKGK